MVEQHDYYAFGLEIPGLSTQANKYQYNPDRYKYNGKELQANEFMDGTGLVWDDYGARMYEPEIARWMVADPVDENFPATSPYVYGNNNPINMIDIKGKYAVSVHYNITYSQLIKLGYSPAKADLIAHYASTYSDHPTQTALFLDALSHFSDGSNVAYRSGIGIDYSITAESQDEKNSMWHSMMSDKEAEDGMTEDQAMLRGLQFGWDNIFASANSKEGKDLGKLGQGLHALQDAFAHRGAKTSDHLGYNLSSAKKLVNDSYGSIGEAENITRSALIVIDVLHDKKSNLKDGDTLDMRGMSTAQLSQFLIKLAKQGFKGTVYNRE